MWPVINWCWKPTKLLIESYSRSLGRIEFFRKLPYIDNIKSICIERAIYTCEINEFFNEFNDWYKHTEINLSIKNNGKEKTTHRLKTFDNALTLVHKGKERRFKICRNKAPNYLLFSELIQSENKYFVGLKLSTFKFENLTIDQEIKISKENEELLSNLKQRSEIDDCIYMIADKRKLEVAVLLSYPWKNIEYLANWKKVSIEADSLDTEMSIQYLKCLPKRLRYELYLRYWKKYFTSKDFFKALEEFEHWIVLHNNSKFEIQLDRSIIEEDIFRRKFKIRNTFNRKIEVIEYEQLIEFLNKT